MKINSNNEKRIPYPVKKTKNSAPFAYLAPLAVKKRPKTIKSSPHSTPNLQFSTFNPPNHRPPSTVHRPPSPIRSSNEKRIKNPSCPFVAFVVKIFPPPSALHPAFCTLQLATINLPTS
jgi:hypothetical protein